MLHRLLGQSLTPSITATAGPPKESLNADRDPSGEHDHKLPAGLGGLAAANRTRLHEY